MAIHAPLPAKRWTLPRNLPVLAALALAGCGNASQPATKRVLDLTERTTDCLPGVWQAQPAPDRVFDRAHDKVDGGSIACATGTTPSQFEAALAAIRAAAASGDRGALLAQVSTPLLAIDKGGQRHELDQDQLASQAFGEAFSPAMIVLLSHARIEDVTVVPDQGAFISLGAAWLAPSRPGGRPRIITVNAQALAEASAAARRAK